MKAEIRIHEAPSAIAARNEIKKRFPGIDPNTEWTMQSVVSGGGTIYVFNELATVGKGARR